MKIVHACITSNVFNKDYAYQDNLLTKYHCKLGHEVSIIAPVYSEFDKESGAIHCTTPGLEVIDDGIKVYRLKPILCPSLDRHIHWFHNFISTLENLQPELLFVHGIGAINYRSLKKYKKHHPQVRIVFDSHADWNNSCQNFLSKVYSRFVIRWFIVPSIKDLSYHFYGVTPARCDFLREMYGIPQEKIDLLPMGADDEEMHIDNKTEIRTLVRNQYDITDEDFLIVTGGKIDILKNIHILAEAVSKSKYRNIKLLIFGSIRDNLKATFSRLQSERIKCIGWVPGSEVYRYFYAADLIVFPGLHSVLWEQAVASQVPCAFSRIKGFEHVDIGGNCVFMEEKTSTYYQDLIEHLYTDKDFYSRLYGNAHSSKAKKFLYSHIAQKVIDDIR